MCEFLVCNQILYLSCYNFQKEEFSTVEVKSLAGFRLRSCICKKCGQAPGRLQGRLQPARLPFLTK